MRDLSLYILDIAENSVNAGADEIRVALVFKDSLLKVSVQDNGRGMDQAFLAGVTDPFVTTGKTRRVGMGIPFFKAAAEITGGSFEIESKEGKGTAVTAVFRTDSLDFVPAGDIGDTMGTLIMRAPNTRFFFSAEFDGRSWQTDTGKIKIGLPPNVAIDDIEVIAEIKRSIQENFENINGGTIL